jgi:hypothetical protein
VVVAREEVASIVDGRGPQVFRLTDGRPMVWVRRREHRSQNLELREPIRTVLVALPALVEDHLALCLEPLRRQGGQEPAHAVGFHPERQSRRVAGYDFPVIGAIAARRPVERRARLLKRLEEPAWLMGRPLEHQVLEQVRQPRATHALVLGADVIPHAHRDEGHVTALVDDDVETVRKRMRRG